MNMFDCMYIVYYNVIPNRGDYMNMFDYMYIVYYNVILTHINKIFILLQREPSMVPTNASLYNEIYYATTRAN